MPCRALGAPASNILSLGPHTLRWDRGWHDTGVAPPLPWGFSGAMAGDEATRTAVHVDQAGATFTWDGHTWAEPHPAHTPAPRLAPPAMAYDAARHEVVLFGGRGWGAAVSYGASRPQGPDLLNDTWTWDGTDWTLRAGTPPSPPPPPPSPPPLPTGKPVPVPQPVPVEPCAVPPHPNSGDDAAGRGEPTPTCTSARTPLPVQ
jgi:hypothetical protein